MTPLQPLLNLFKEIHPVSPAFQQSLEANFTITKVSKKEHLLYTGETAHSYYFVLTGVLRSYLLLDGKEITTRFVQHGQFITSPVSFFEQQPGTEQIEALTNCRLAILHRKMAEQLFMQYGEMNIIARVLLERYLVRLEKINQLLRIKLPADRIISFSKEFPGLINLLPDKMIAGFLNLSRVGFCNKKNELIQSGVIV